MQQTVVWFREVSKDDGNLVGGKGANLGELTRMGIPVPPGFIVTARSYVAFLKEAGIEPKIRDVLNNLNPDDTRRLQEASRTIKKLIQHAPMPKEIELDIQQAYEKLWHRAGKLVAVRSSATAEDLPEASFAGQQETFLNVSGTENVIAAVKGAWASLFESRAIFYRAEKRFDHFNVGIAVPVQAMVQSVVSGVVFTVDPVTGDKQTLVIEAVWGLGEMIVQGKVTPDHYVLEKRTMKIMKKEYVEQTVELVRRGTKTEEQKIPPLRKDKPKLQDRDIQTLAEIALKIERHYYFPQDIEWAWDGIRFSIVQTRPVTILSLPQKKGAREERKTGLSQKVALRGSPASPGIATGPVRIVHRMAELFRVKKGDVLVTEMTNPDFVPAMRRAAAVVTDRGGRTSHAAIVSRELGIPAVVGTEHATSRLTNGEVVTVDGTTGEIMLGGAFVRQKRGVLPPEAPIKKRIVYANKTATKIYVNLAEPERAWEVSMLNVDGVGLLRAEFMIAEMGVHPKKLLRDGHGARFTSALARGIETFAQAFHPRPVVYRATDFKTNEYRNLKGGSSFEPEEPNPMLGYRGCYRYIHDPSVFRLEVNAIKVVREKYDNVWFMLPFVRTVGELKAAKTLLSRFGVRRSPTFHLWMMVEIPSNVIQLADFIETGIDGVSIGSNDLTMLLLGTDRDNSEVAEEFDERNPSVMWALKRVIRICLDYRCSASICGQAPSTYPDLAEKLVEWGITSISVSPDAVDEVRAVVAEAERGLGRRRI